MSIINFYETVMVFSMTNGEEAINALKEKFNTLIGKNATIISVDEWGKRRLAYPINDETEGFYVLVNFTSEPAFIAELDRIYKITDGVLRSIVIKKEPVAEKAKVAAVEETPVVTEKPAATKPAPTEEVAVAETVAEVAELADEKKPVARKKPAAKKEASETNED